MAVTSNKAKIWLVNSRGRECCRAIIPYQFICNFLLRLTPVLPSSPPRQSCFFNPSYPIHPQHLTCHPPPPNFYQSRQAYWGNPYTAANSDDNSDDMSAAASNPTVTVAGLTTKSSLCYCQHECCCCRQIIRI